MSVGDPACLRLLFEVALLAVLSVALFRQLSVFVGALGRSHFAEGNLWR